MQDDQSPVSTANSSISWTASEYIAHEKSAGWYAALAAGAAVIAILIYFLTKDVISTIVVVVAALLLGVYAGRQPRQLDYQVDGHGLSIGSKRYSFGDFRSFSVVPEGAFSSIVFMPLKRFAPPLSIYYAPDDEDKIVKILSNQLPFEQPRRDIVENLMRRIRF